MTFGIETLFYQRAPPHILLDAIRSQRDWPMPSLQLNLCDIICKHAEYHPPIDWMKFLVKNIVDDIELNDVDMCDELAEIAVSCVSSNISNKDGYVIYEIDDEKALYVFVHKICNEVGLKIWPAAIYVAGILHNSPWILDNKHVLELGSGTGCTGFILASSHNIQSVTLTDYEQSVIYNLHQNYLTNKKILESKEVNITRCDWSQFSIDNYEYHPPQVIIAADCVYSPDIIMPLLSTINQLLLIEECTQEKEVVLESPDSFQIILDTTTNTLRAPKIALIAFSIRNVHTFLALMDCLQKFSSLVYQDVTGWANNLFTTQTRFYTSEDINTFRLLCLAKNSNSV